MCWRQTNDVTSLQPGAQTQRVMPCLLALHVAPHSLLRLRLSHHARPNTNTGRWLATCSSPRPHTRMCLTRATLPCAAPRGTHLAELLPIRGADVTDKQHNWLRLRSARHGASPGRRVHVRPVLLQCLFCLFCLRPQARCQLACPECRRCAGVRCEQGGSMGSPLKSPRGTQRARQVDGEESLLKLELPSPAMREGHAVRGSDLTRSARARGRRRKARRRARGGSPPCPSRPSRQAAGE